MNKQTSAGVVIFRREGKAFRFLLLHHGAEYWNVPKGRIEAGEDEMTAALRELREETGISQVKIIEGFRYEYEYDFDSTIKGGIREKISKRAIFFLGEVTSDTVTISHEHLDYGWFDYQTAFQRMFYQRGQQLLQAAHQFLLEKQDFVL